MTGRQAGGSAMRQELVRVRNAAGGIRSALERMDGCGPQTLAVLISKVAVQLTVIFDALAELDHIGQDAKAIRKDRRI